MQIRLLPLDVFPSNMLLFSLNQTMLYSMSAFLDEGIPGQSTMQGYDVRNDMWRSLSVSDGSFNFQDRSKSMHASSFEGGGSLSFIAGGHHHLTGMVIFNSSNTLQPSWTNVTDGSTPFFWNGVTEYIWFGDAGILISVGGFLGESTPQTGSLRPLQREMNSVQVYDIASMQWFTIFATGDIPSPRARA